MAEEGDFPPAGYEQSFNLWADAAGIPLGSTNERMVLWLQDALGSANDSLPGLWAEAALSLGVDTQNQIGFSLSDLLTIDYFYMNGTNQDIVLDNPWVPEGYPYSIEITTESDAYGAPGNAVSGADYTNASLTTFIASNLNAGLYQDYAGVDQVAGSVTDGSSKRQWKISCTAEGTKFYLNGEEGADGVDSPALTIGAEPYEFIGAPGRFPGIAKNAYFTDSSPIQGREYQVGEGYVTDRVRGDLIDKIPIDTSKPFNIKWSWERQNTTTNQQCAFVSFTDTEPRFIVMAFDTGNAKADDLQFQTTGGQYIFAGALEHIAIGQKANYELTCDASQNLRLFIHGLEVADSPQTYIDTTAVCAIGHLGGSSGGGNAIRGAFADMEVTCTGPEQALPFLSWEDRNHSRVIDTAALTGSAEIGSLIPGSATTDFDADGVIVPNEAGGGLNWDAAFINSTDMATKGFTLHFEIESGVFDEAYTPDQVDAGLMFLTNPVPATWDGPSFITSKLAWGNYQDTAANTKTSSGASGSHDDVDISVAVNGDYVLYRNQMPIGQGTLDATPATMNAIYVLGVNGLAGLATFSPQYRVRNCLLAEGVIDESTAAKIVCAASIGDSNLVGAQYQSSRFDVNNDAVLKGYDQIDGQYGTVNDHSIDSLPYAATPTNDPPIQENLLNWKTDTGFAWIHHFMAQKNIVPHNGDAYQLHQSARYSCGILAGSTGNNLTDRVDALLGVTGYPAPPTAALDWVFSDCGGLDIVNSSNDTSFAAPAVTEYLRVIDRLLDAGVTRVMIVSPARYYSLSGSQTYVEATAALISEMQARIPTHPSGRVFFADISTAWQPEWTGGDGIHYNQAGHKVQAAAIASMMPDYKLSGEQTYTYPLERNSYSDTIIENTDPVTGGAFEGEWQGTNWTNYPLRSRRYKINDNNGAALEDSLHKGEAFYNATISNHLAAGGGWNYEP